LAAGSLRENSHIDLQFKGDRPGGSVGKGFSELVSEDGFLKNPTRPFNLVISRPKLKDVSGPLASITDTAFFAARVIVAENVAKTPVPETASCEPATTFPPHFHQTMEAWLKRQWT